ncbi:hypothetical protein NCF86_03570 [Pelagerythrobacter marinus]|nr:hypothetical protein NCF86_03570 [Pelagerythrobacter marinus]
MNCDQVDAFVAASGKSLPAAPTWIISTSRKGERRCYLPIAVDGVVSGLQLEFTIYMHSANYLVINLLAPQCITRLCTVTPHWDRAIKSLVPAPHIHRWADNRPKGPRLPKTLPHASYLPDLPAGRDAAFRWFLDEIGVESPPWAMDWPDNEGLI